MRHESKDWRPSLFSCKDPRYMLPCTQAAFSMVSGSLVSRTGLHSQRIMCSVIERTEVSILSCFFCLQCEFQGHWHSLWSNPFRSSLYPGFDEVPRPVSWTASEVLELLHCHNYTEEWSFLYHQNISLHRCWAWTAVEPQQMKCAFINNLSTCQSGYLLKKIICKAIKMIIITSVAYLCMHIHTHTDRHIHLP